MKTWERTRWVERINAKIVRPYYKFGTDEIEGYIIQLGNGQEISRTIQHIKGNSQMKVNKASYQPSSKMTGRDSLGRRNSRLQYIMKYKEVKSIINKKVFEQIQSAWEKVKSPLGYSAYRDTAKELEMPVGRLMQYLKGMHEENPYSVRFGINRAGENVYFKLLKK